MVNRTPNVCGTVPLNQNQDVVLRSSFLAASLCRRDVNRQNTLSSSAQVLTFCTRLAISHGESRRQAGNRFSAAGSAAFLKGRISQFGMKVNLARRRRDEDSQPDVVDACGANGKTTVIVRWAEFEGC